MPTDRSGPRIATVVCALVVVTSSVVGIVGVVPAGPSGTGLAAGAAANTPTATATPTAETPTPTSTASSGGTSSDDEVDGDGTTSSSSSSTSSSNTIEVVVYNVTANQTTRYTVDGPPTGGSGDENTSPINDTRKWVRTQTQYAPWDREFSPLVSLGGCTGVMVDEYHVLTAAHCVYNNSAQEWTAKGTVAPAAERVGADTTTPYGEANIVLVRTYAPFVDSSDPESDGDAAANDMALLTIDRPLGARTGTVDWAYRNGSSLNESVFDGARVDIAGYPGTPPNASAPTPSLWWDYGNTTGDYCTGSFGFTSCREASLTYNVFTSKGQSGAPVIHNPAWANVDGVTNEPVILAVHAYGSVNGNGEDDKGHGPRITPNRSDHLESWIANDSSASPGDTFAYQATSRPALSFVSVRTAVPDNWYDWERTDPHLEVLNNSTVRYERDIVNLGNGTFDGTITVRVTSSAFSDFTKEVTVDSLQPGETVTFAFERRVTGGPGDANLNVLLKRPSNLTAVTTVLYPELVVRPARPDAWPSSQYSAQQTGHSPHTAGPSGPGIGTNWAVSLDDDAFTSTAVVNDTVYAVSQNATVYAINETTGRVAWQRTVGAPNASVNETGVAVGQGNVYVGVDNFETNATVYGINRTTREVDLAVDGNGPRVDGITVTHDSVYANAGGVFVIYPNDGNVQNSSSLTVQGEPAIYNGNDILVARGGDLAAYDILGDERWNVSIARYLKGVTVDDEFGFVRDANKTLYAVDIGRSNSRVAWTFTTGSTAGEWTTDVEPVIVDDRVIIGDDAGILYALSTASGVAYWTTPLPSGASVRSLAGANGTVYVTASDDTVYAVDASDGSLRWSESVDGGLYAPPTVSDGQVFVTTAEGDAGRVVALQSTTPQANFTYAPSAPATGDSVRFNASLSTAPGGNITEYAWDFDGDNTTDATGVTVNRTFDAPGEVTVTLRITTDDNASSTTTRTVDVGVGSCLRITEPGGYVLAANITNASEDCIEIAANDVTFRGQGHRIDGNVSVEQYSTLPDYPQLNGVTVTGTNVTVANVTLSDWYRGVSVQSTGDVTVRATTARTSAFGVVIDGSTNVTVRASTINHTEDGFALTGYRSSELTVRNATIGNNGAGIRFTEVTDSRIVGSRVLNSTYNGLDVSRGTARTIVRDNVVVDNGRKGLTMYDARNNTVVANRFETNAKGLNLDQTNATRVRNNSFRGQDSYAVRLQDSHDNTLVDNVLEGFPTPYGILLDGQSSRNRIVTNRIDRYSDALRLESAPRNTLRGNDVEGTNSIYVLSSPATTILNNTVTDSGSEGIELYSSPNSTVRANNASANAYEGFAIGSVNVTVVENLAVGNGGEGFAVVGGSDHAVIRNNTARANANAGIAVTDAADSRLRNNTLADNRLYVASPNVTVRNLTVTNGTVAVSETRNVSIADGRLRGGAYGIEVFGSQRVVVRSTIVRNATTAVRFYGSSHNRLEAVTVVNSTWGVYPEPDFGGASARNNTARNLTLRANGSATTLSLTSTDVAVGTAASSPAPPDSYRVVGQALRAQNTSGDANASLTTTVGYNATRIADAGLNESSVRLWTHDSTWTAAESSTLDTQADEVSGTVDPPSAAGNVTVAPLAEELTVATVNATNATAAPGTNATVSFNLTHEGGTQRDFTLNVTTPENVSIVNQTADGGEWSDSTAYWRWTAVDPGVTLRPTLTVRVPENASGPVSVDAVATSNGTTVARTTATVTVCETVPEAIDADDDGRIGDFEVLDAIEYWRDGGEVPGTCGETIGDFEVLDIIELWRDDAQV